MERVRGNLKYKKYSPATTQRLVDVLGFDSYIARRDETMKQFPQKMQVTNKRMVGNSADSNRMEVENENLDLNKSFVQDGSHVIILDESATARKESEPASLNGSIVRDERKDTSVAKIREVRSSKPPVQEMEVEDNVPPATTRPNRFESSTQAIVNKQFSIQNEKKLQQADKEVTQNQLSELKKQLEASKTEKHKPTPVQQSNVKPKAAEPVPKPSKQSKPIGYESEHEISY